MRNATAAVEVVVDAPSTGGEHGVPLSRKTPTCAPLIIGHVKTMDGSERPATTFPGPGPRLSLGAPGLSPPAICLLSTSTPPPILARLNPAPSEARLRPSPVLLKRRARDRVVVGGCLGYLAHPPAGWLGREATRAAPVMGTGYRCFFPALLPHGVGETPVVWESREAVPPPGTVRTTGCGSCRGKAGGGTDRLGGGWTQGRLC